MRNQVHIIYDIYAFYTKYPHIVHTFDIAAEHPWVCDMQNFSESVQYVCDMQNFLSFFLQKWGDPVLKVDH